MRATHIDYLHPGHLRVEDGRRHLAYAMTHGFYEVTALCVGPSSSYYKRLCRPDLPKWPGGVIVDGVEIPRPRPDDDAT